MSKTALWLLIFLLLALTWIMAGGRTPEEITQHAQDSLEDFQTVHMFECDDAYVHQVPRNLPCRSTEQRKADTDALKLHADRTWL